MDGSFDYTELVEKAQLGDEASMNRLAELARESLRRYVFRVTLDEAIPQDIVQEVMLEMFKVLGKLKRVESEYLGDYIDDATVMFCPNAPRQYTYLQESWDAGDEWDNPDTTFPSDPVTGSYCFYWNYVGFLEERGYPFKGPSGSSGGRRRSKVLVSDYFGYDHWRSRNSYGSCERFKGASVVLETWLLSAYWSVAGDKGLDEIQIKLRAGYTDGHVESYSAREVTTMKVSITSDGSVPYPTGVGAGDFYLPRNCLP